MHLPSVGQAIKNRLVAAEVLEFAMKARDECDGRMLFSQRSAISCSMTPQELTEFRSRMGWSQAELGRRLELSPSRLADYETGFTRGRARRPAPIPKAVELACAWLEEHEGKKSR
jgi:DNA-binding transcriptional regulator YiaG